MKFEWFISRRLVRIRKGDVFVSVVTLIAIFGVAIGVSTVSVVLSVMTGFDKEFERKITANLPQIVVKKDGGLKDYGSVADRIGGIENVSAVRPFLSGQGLLRYRDRMCGVSIIGIDSVRGFDEEVEKLLSFAEDGKQSLSPGEEGKRFQGIILGKNVALKLGVLNGSVVECISADFSEKTGKLKPVLVKYLVRGVFESGVYDIDSGVTYIWLEAAQELFGSAGLAGGIEVKVKDIYRAGDVSGKIKEHLGEDYSVTTWMERYRNLFSALRLEKTVMFFILALIVVVAAFNITATLIMVVTEKIKDIGILRSIGATKGSIARIFLCAGTMIGLCGICLGLAGGVSLCLLLKRYPIVRLPQDIYLIGRLPVEISITDFISICAVAFLMSILSSLYPAVKASKVNVVEALRYE